MTGHDTQFANLESSRSFDPCEGFGVLPLSMRTRARVPPLIVSKSEDPDPIAVGRATNHHFAWWPLGAPRQPGPRPTIPAAGIKLHLSWRGPAAGIQKEHFRPWGIKLRRLPPSLSYLVTGQQTTLLSLAGRIASMLLPVLSSL